MNKIDMIVSDLCNDIDRLTAERNEWKRKYEEVNEKFKPRYMIEGENYMGRRGILRDVIFLSRVECQKECEKMDAQFPGIRHWPEEI